MSFKDLMTHKRILIRHIYTSIVSWCMVLTTPVEMHTTLSAKNAYALVHARIYNGAEASLPWKLLRTYLESCTSIVQVVVCSLLLPPLLLSRPNPSPDAVRSRNSSKSMLAHDAVAAAVSHKHHSIIRVGAGLIQFVYGSHARLATELTPSKRFPAMVFAGFSVCCHICKQTDKYSHDTQQVPTSLFLSFEFGKARNHTRVLQHTNSDEWNVASRAHTHSTHSDTCTHTHTHKHTFAHTHTYTHTPSPPWASVI